MPALIRLYIRHTAIGFVLGVAFTGLLLWVNVGNLWHLVRATEGGLLAVVMLVVFNTIVFAGVQFAIAVMGMAADDPGQSGTRTPVAEALPAAVASGGNRSSRAGVNFPRA